MGWNPGRSLRARLIVAFLILGLVPLTLVSVVAYRSAESSLTQSARARLEDVAFNAIDKLDRNLSDRYGDVQAFALSYQAQTMLPERVAKWIDTMMVAYSPNYKLMVVVNKQGKIVAVNRIDLDGKPLPKARELVGRDVSGEAWYQRAMSGEVKDGTSLVEDVHHDALMATVYGAADGADLAMSFTAPIKGPDGEIIGVWSSRFNWEVATTILAENAGRAHASGMTTVELGLAATGGAMLASPNASDVLVGSYAGRSGVGDPNAPSVGSATGTTLDGAPGLEGWARSGGYSTYPGMGWTLVASQSRDEALGAAHGLGMLMLMAGLIAAGAIVGGAWLVARPIERGVRQVASAARGLAVGDLDQHVDVRSQDEVGQMATAVTDMIAYQQAIASVAERVADGDLRGNVQPASERDVLGVTFNQMVAQLAELLARTRSSAADVADISTTMDGVTSEAVQTVRGVTASVRRAAADARTQSDSMHEVTRSVDRLLQAIDQVALGAQEQARNLSSASAQAEEMANGVERVAGAAEDVAESGRTSRETAERGASAVRAAVVRMGEIERAVEQASLRVSGLGELGQRIGSVVETIDDIAEQTNLLALNAAIEAARAGEHGRGFAVVADEVRKLAERSQRETKAIAALVEEVRGGTEEAVRAMATGADRVRAGARQADDAGVALTEILTAVEGTVGAVEEISEASREMMARGRAVSDALMRLSAVVEEASATTEEMSATAGEVGRSVQEIAVVVDASSVELDGVASSAELMHEQMTGIESRADRLASTAADLRALVAKFRLEEGATMSSVAPSRVRTPDHERLAS
ncbi:MAG: methyl-accepting chemotaxis protein [Chloroflexota bacterium]